MFSPLHHTGARSGVASLVALMSVVFVKARDMELIATSGATTWPRMEERSITSPTVETTHGLHIHSILASGLAGTALGVAGCLAHSLINKRRALGDSTTVSSPGATKNDDSASALKLRSMEEDGEQPVKDTVDAPSDSESTDIASCEALSSQEFESLPPRAAQAWRPAARLFGVAEPSEAERGVRQTVSILNKLTRERFETLYAQLFALCAAADDFVREQLITAVAKEVFAKATKQHMLVDLYVDVCVRLRSDLAQLTADCGAQFKQSLIAHCEESFTRYLAPPTVNTELDMEEQYEEFVKHKTAMLGNVLLLGRLLSKKMMSQKLIFHVAEQLMQVSSPEALETLCTFLESIGSTFDTPEWKDHRKLDEIFVKLQAVRKDSATPARVRFLIQDLLDRRQAGWRSAAQKMKRQDFERLQSKQPRPAALEATCCKPTRCDTVLKSGSGRWNQACASLGSARAALKGKPTSPAPSAASAEAADSVSLMTSRISPSRSDCERRPAMKGRFGTAAAGGSGGGRGASGRGGGSGSRSICRFLVGIEQDEDFHVCRRLIGPRGAHMMDIIAKAPDAKVRIRGKGSKYLEGPERAESTDPLMICVSTPTGPSFEVAAAMVAELLGRVHDDYRFYCRSRGLAAPALSVRRE